MLKSGQVWTGTFVTLDATGALAAASVGPIGALYVAGVVTLDSVTISGTNPYKFSVTLPTLTAGQSVGMYVTATVGGIATAAVVAEDVADTKRISDLNDAASAPAAATVASAVRTELTTELAAVNTNLDAKVSTRSTLAGTAQTGDAYAVVTDVNYGNSALHTHVAAIPTNPYTGTPPTAAAVADAIWDEALSEHVAAGSFGEILGDVDAEVWTYASRTLTQSAASVTAAVSGSTVTMVPYTTWEFTLTGLADLSDAAVNGILFTVKRTQSDADTDALLMVQEGVGLAYLNGSSTVTAAKATLTIGAGETDITVHVNASQTGAIAPNASLVYSVKKIVTTLEDADQVTTGVFVVSFEEVARKLAV